MKKYLVVIALLSLATHFIYFGHPKSVVFDEVHFGNFSSAYTTGSYFFDIHPPLGKLLISGAGYIGGYQATSTNYATIGNTFGDPRYMWYRILPMIAGSLLPVVVFLLAIEIGISPLFSFFAGLLVILENSILVQSRFILLDAFLLLFGFAGLLFYAYSKKAVIQRRKMWFTVASAVLVTLSYSVKWTGLSFIGIIVLVELYGVWKSDAWKKESKEVLKKAGIYAGVGFVLYFSLFLVHFSLLPKSGPGDAFMTPEFQKTLAGNVYENNTNVKPLNLVQKFIELNKEMYRANATLTATHQYGSVWYEWPYMKRTVFYWESPKTENGQKMMIYLLGNPFVYWLSSFAVAFLLIYLLGEATVVPFYRKIRKKSAKEQLSYLEKHKMELLLILAYLANWLPFALVSRVAFLYHYEAALVVAIIVTAYIVDKNLSGKSKIIAFALLSFAALAGFLYFSPLTYGISMNEADLMKRFWLSTWR